ncbi:hypothetical protein BDN72DRAFT_879638 [Pluteus cervinus]|uniref:Uncharacterized protein n=1 Tax=Pluteus cervinus TaxID=181527 RepID=A0ACD3APM8_9AGAR|nr:hypothetical protein BDN72DRAFT_879638 [Pluteus cervinus]
MLPELDTDLKIPSRSSTSPSPVLTYRLPPLPKIDGDSEIILDVYRHRTLRGDTELDNSEYGDVWRLSDLGEQVFKTVATLHYFSKQPLEYHKAIVDLRRNALNEEKILEISRFYNIARHLRASPTSRVEDDVEELRHFWYGFIGALYIRNGLDAVRDWVSRVIDPLYEPPTIRSESLSPSTPATSTRSGTPPPLHGVNYRYTGQYGGYRAGAEAAAPGPPAAAPAPAPPPPPAVHHSDDPYQDSQPPPFTSAPQPGPSNTPNYMASQPGPSNAPQYTAPQAYSGPPLSLSAFHEMAQKYGCQPTYSAESDGPPHARRWTMRCYLDGVERGSGAGATQKLAKGEAARNAWINMGWGSL